MSQSAIRLLTLASCASALIAPMAMPAAARTNSHKHHNIHWSHVHRGDIYRSHGFGYPPPALHASPVTRPAIPPGQVCPGMGRSFDCKIWPPPFDEDPDRKVSGSDGA